jgi:DNA invertase Pin-like site-specific DNA recombinase
MVTIAKAAVYARISSDREDNQLGVKRQLEDCLALCAARSWTVAAEHEYVDNDVTAADPSKVRPAYERLIGDMKRGAFDHVVVWAEDRLHRQPAELEAFISAAVLAGVGLTSVRGGDTDLTDQDALVMARVKGAFAAAEVAKLRARVSRQKDALARAGGDNGGPRPFGFEPDRVTIRASEAAVIREAVELLLSGRTVYEIATAWNADPNGPRTATGREWSWAGLRRLLRAPRIAGLRQHHDAEPVQAVWGRVFETGEWGSIIDRPTWERVCASLAPKASRSTVQTHRSYLLRGVLKCECGRFMSGAASGERLPDGTMVKKRYGCKKGKLGHYGCGSTVLASFVEDYTSSLVATTLDLPGLTAVIGVETEAEADTVRTLVADNAADESKLVGLGDDYADGTIDKATYARQAQRIRDRIAGRIAQLATIRSTSVLDRYAGRGSEWETLDKDTQRAVISALIESVTVKRGERGARLPDLQMIQSGADKAADEWAKLQDRVQVQWRYSAIEPLIEQIGTGHALPHFVYQAAARHPALAAMDTAALEYARNLKVPARVKAAIAKAEKAEAAKAEGHRAPSHCQ